MSDMTSTNEEDLALIMQRLGHGHYLMLECEHRFINVYEVPCGYDFNFMTPAQKEQFFKCAFWTLALHEDVWQVVGNPAKYR